MDSINPATGQSVGTYEEIDDAALETRIDAAARTFEEWRRVAFDERARLMDAAARVLDQDARSLGRLMTREMGKPIGAAIAEAEKCAWVCRYYAEHAERFLADEEVETDASRSWVAFQPIGPVLAIMPWNFPFWQVFRFAAPALMAGNVGLLKHASNVPGCALAIEDVFRRAGFPDGAFQTLMIGSARVENVIADRRIRAVTLTGSEPAGIAVATAAGSRIKKTVLELGGSDPFIVMPSADFDRAVETAVKARTINNGQSCIAAKRFIVHEDIAERFENAFVERMRGLRMGDPMDEDTDIGPLATAAIRGDLHEQVRASVDAGARLVLGGEIPDGDGWFYPPTVLADIPDGCPAADDELFGPVASIFRVPDLDGAIERANATSFGLGAAAWTNDEDEQRRFIRDLDAGCVFINGMVASDPRLPFGGVRRSGYGRELSRYGILEFVNIRTVSIA
jgi:succinate-semialdehyde dehydrogenase/glutarate-semialdehyde dehydrogenase